MPADSSARSDRPNLGQKKKLAKELLQGVRKLDRRSALRFTWSTSKFRGRSAEDVIREGVTLADAQHVIARESGFESWPKLRQYIEELIAAPEGPIAAFEDAVHYIIRGETEELQNLLAVHPEVATMRSPRQHGGVLPHYLAANGVEDEHQITPPNAVEVAQVLFAAGADAVVDATADVYGGGGGSTPLVALVTSAHPHDAGVQADLVRAFCDAGAKVDGIDDDGLPLASALGFRYPKAAQALAERGARIDNLAVAAALGRFEVVQRVLDPADAIPSEPREFHNPYLAVPRSVAPHPDALLQLALVFACMNGQRDVAELLLDSGVDINAGPRNGITSLHEACYQGDLEMVKFLLDRGADPTSRDSYWHSTAIGWASQSQDSRVAEEIIRRGRIHFLDAVEMKRYDLARAMLEQDRSLANAPDGMGGALRFAAHSGDLKLAEMLLEFGADRSLKNEAGLAAIECAEKAGHQKIVALLRDE